MFSTSATTRLIWSCLGETSRSFGERAREHLANVENQNSKTFMVKPILEQHLALSKSEQGNMLNWGVTHIHMNALGKQLREATEIMLAGKRSPTSLTERKNTIV